MCACVCACMCVCIIVCVGDGLMLLLAQSHLNVQITGMMIVGVWR